MKKIILLALTTVLLVGCGKSPNKHFEDYVTNEAKKVIVTLNPETSKYDFLSYFSLVSIEYNVVKTDSLTSPYTAYVIYQVFEPGDDSELKEFGYVSDILYKIKLDYAYQDNRWVLKTATLYDFDADFKSGNKLKFNDILPLIRKNVSVYDGVALDQMKEKAQKDRVGFLWRDF